MVKRQQNSLPKILFIQEASLLLLLILTSISGILSAYFWQQSSGELLRLNHLSDISEQIRSQLFQQIQAAVRARLNEDTHSLILYKKYSRQIDKNFNQLHSQATIQAEKTTIQSLHIGYRTIQKDMNEIFADVYSLQLETRMRILDPRFAETMLRQFETEHEELKSILRGQHKALHLKLKKWSQYSPIIILTLLLLAFFFVIYSRAIFRRQFLTPVSTIIADAQLISCGDLEARMHTEGVEEVQILAKAINKMAHDLRISQAALIESEKQAVLGALVPVIAHNIRNPLASIRATAQILSDPHDLQELNEGKEAIISTTDRLNRWVNSLVSYLHPLKPNYRLTHISEILLAVLSLLKIKIEEKDIQIIKQDWHNDLRLNVDPDLMEQAIYGLLTNAIDASPKAARLIIRLVKKDIELEIHIQDEGGGIPFDPTPNQLTPGRSTKNFGTGLGIPIAFKICQNHSWRLRFNSTESVGTEVIIIAPIRVIEESDNNEG